MKVAGSGSNCAVGRRMRVGPTLARRPVCRRIGAAQRADFLAIARQGHGSRATFSPALSEDAASTARNRVTANQGLTPAACRVDVAVRAPAWCHEARREPFCPEHHQMRGIPGERGLQSVS